MSTEPDQPTADTTQGPHGPETGESTDITFSTRGDAALDELAAALTADLINGLASDPSSDATPDPAAIAAVLGRVMSADLEDLVAAVTAADHARPATVDDGISHGLDDGELALGREPHEVEWETVRAPMIQPGDLTPVSRVDDVEFHGGVRRVDLTIDGTSYSRSFDDRVDRVRPATDPSQDPTTSGTEAPGAGPREGWLSAAAAAGSGPGRGADARGRRLQLHAPAGRAAGRLRHHDERARVHRTGHQRRRRRRRRR